MSTIPQITPPVGVPNGAGGFVNPSAFSVSTANLLPPVFNLAMPRTTQIFGSLMASRNAGMLALEANNRERITSPSSQMSSALSAVGSEGTLGMDGANVNSTPVGGIQAVGAQAVGEIAAWQMRHPKLDFALRIGLPIAAVWVFRKGQTFEAALLAAPAAALWGKRLGAF